MLVLPAFHHWPICGQWRDHQHDCACLLQAEKLAAQNGAANGDVPAADGKGLAPVNTKVDDTSYDSDENDEVRYRIRVEAARGELFLILVPLCWAELASPQTQSPTPYALHTRSLERRRIPSKHLHSAFPATCCCGFGSACVDVKVTWLFCGCAAWAVQQWQERCVCLQSAA